jgi:hypothetical protein
MLVAAFLLTGLGGILIGIWLTGYVIRGQMSLNPAKLLAFTDTVRIATVEMFSAEITHEFDEYEGPLSVEGCKRVVKDAEAKFKRQHLPKR